MVLFSARTASFSPSEMAFSLAAMNNPCVAAGWRAGRDENAAAAANATSNMCTCKLDVEKRASKKKIWRADDGRGRAGSRVSAGAGALAFGQGGPR